MNLWLWVLAAGGVSFLTKFSGYLIPARFLENERVFQISQQVTVGLLAALLVTNTFSSGASLVLDARIAALAAAVVALMLRAPFIVVVIAGALAAAGARALGMA